MKNLATLAAIALTIMGCTAPRADQQVSPETKVTDRAQGDGLFLHLLAPPAFGTNRAHRIVTARVYPAEYFAISLGEPDNPFTNRWDAAWTKPRWNKDGEPEARPPESLWYSGDAVLAGRIEQRSHGYFAQLQGRSNTSLNYYRGEIELEKPVSEQGGWYRSNTLWGVWFVLSASADCGRFLEALDNGTLQDLAVVPADSPVARRWTEKTSGAAPRPPSSTRGAAPRVPTPPR